MAPLALQCGMLPGEDVHPLLQMNYQQLLPYGLAAAECPLDETVVARLAGAASAAHAACLALQNPAAHDYAEKTHVEIVVFQQEGLKPELRHPLWGFSAVLELYFQTENPIVVIRLDLVVAAVKAVKCTEEPWNTTVMSPLGHMTQVPGCMPAQKNWLQCQQE